MTPDLTTRAVEIMAEAIAALCPMGSLDSCRWEHENGGMEGRCECRKEAEAAWRALLAARTNCETCGNAGEVEYPTADDSPRGFRKCPDCAAGRGDGLLVAILMEPAYTSTGGTDYYIERPAP